MLTIEDIKKRIAPMNKREVARRSGISYGAVRNLLKAEADPKHATIKKVSEFLESLQ